MCVRPAPAPSLASSRAACLVLCRRRARAWKEGRKEGRNIVSAGRLTKRTPRVLVTFMRYFALSHCIHVKQWHMMLPYNTAMVSGAASDFAAPHTSHVPRGCRLYRSGAL